MALKDLKISTQLRLGFSAVLAFVLLLGALAWQQSDSLWQSTQRLHDHPLQVRTSLGDIRFGILAMHRGMKDLCLTEGAQERQAILKEIDSSEADIQRRFEVVYDRYLGARSDIDEFNRAFAQWRTIRADTIRLLHEGKTKEAVQRTTPRGPGGAHVEKMLGELEDINRFAINKSQQLYQDASTQRESLKVQFGMVIGVILVLTLGLLQALLQRIRLPLQELTAVTDRFRRGELSARSNYTAANEFGILSTAFNGLAATVEGEMSFKEQAALLNAAMLREHEARASSRQVLQLLMQLTGSEVGAIYLLNAEKTSFEQFESIGLGTAGRASFSATAHEGEFGAALATRQLQHLTAIPNDTRFIFSTVSGDLVPREILTIPLLAGDEVTAMLSLASLHGYGPAAVRLPVDMQSALMAWMNGLLANRSIRALTEDLTQQNNQLQVQQEELRVVNEELEEQGQQLQQSEEELRVQQEELRVYNEELEEKNNLLEQQKINIETSRQALAEKAEELALASKYKSEFLANMSHELRTPLNSLLLLAQGLARNREGNLSVEQVEAARIIHGGGSDLLTLINEILDLSKIEAGRIELQFDVVPVSGLAESVRDSFQHLAEEKGITLEIIVSDDAPIEILSDRMRVEQILRNFIANAIKFTEAGSVTVRFCRPSADTDLSESGLDAGTCLAVAAKDTGIGISSKLHKVVFEAFQQADGGTSRKYGGTGLGLSISRELAALLGGEIQLTSELGTGSTFTLYLPRDPVHPVSGRNALAISPKLTAASESRPSQLHDDRDSLEPNDRVMLIIEDDPVFARLLCDKGRGKGFKCLLAQTGEAGLELTNRHLPGAIILALHLPDMDGLAVLSALKGDVRIRHIPVHIFSADDASTESLRKGAVGHATKPVSQEDLEVAFRRLEKASIEKPKRLLVVDDDPTIRRNTVKLIGNGDVTTDEAENAEQAMTALRSQQYDCVVLDLGLPDLDGDKLLARLEGEGVVLPPIVIYTARNLTRDEEATIREHSRSIVIKDVRSQERLLDEVSLFLHRVVNRMPRRNRKIIQDLHDTDALLTGKKILVVDDDMRTTFAIAHLLANCGMKPLKAENGERALRLLEEHPDVDLVLMDIMMPVMDGYETMKRIRAQEKFLTLPIIALTAKAMPEDRAQCLSAGANDYLPKPLDQGRLFSMMRVWLCR